MYTNVFSHIFSRLYEVQCNITMDDFQVIFGTRAAHLWDKFASEYNFNLLDFFNHLDEANKHLMCAAILPATLSEKKAILRMDYQSVIDHIASEIELRQSQIPFCSIAYAISNQCIADKATLKRLHRLVFVLTERKNKLS